MAQRAPARDTAASVSKREPPIFAPLTLGPAPSATRLATGAPGPKYWQNRADYDLQATLDTATKTVYGTMVLRYTNHSPTPLPSLWLQTEHRSEVIERFDQVVHGQPVPLTYGHPTGDVFETQVTLAEPLKRGETATLHVAWHFTIKGGERAGTLYQIAQWYPRLNVYDDVKGWNTESYATGTEFYLEYGDYTLAVTVPAGYIVAATGTLDNPQDVLTAAERQRLAVATTADTVVRIVTSAELKSGAARPTQSGMLTWKFHAKNMRDAVWCASPDYQWDATSWHGILTQAYYRSLAALDWMYAADRAQVSIQEYSERWFPYPYPQVSVVEGPESGMEYPMLAMVGSAGEYSVLTHEVGHNLFPMLVGSNERVHPWMDEGFNTFINAFSEARYSPDGGTVDARLGQEVWQGHGPVLETGAVTGNAGAQYDKTAYVLQLLRRDVLGPAVFDSAFRTYIRRWAYKHPTPVDFFRTMADVAGRKLDWFWREGFLEAPAFDQAIDSVTQTMQGTETRVTVTYRNKARAVFPLLVRFTFSDSTARDVTYPVEVWQTHPTTYTVSYTFTGKTVSRIVLDPDRHLPDADRANNVWPAK